MAKGDDGLTGIVPSPASPARSASSSSGLGDDDEEEGSKPAAEGAAAEAAGEAPKRQLSSAESGLSASSSSSEEKPGEVDEDEVVRSLAALKDDLRPELAGCLSQPTSGEKAAKKEAMRVADSVAQVVDTVRRSSVSKGKPAPSLRAFNEARRNSHGGAAKHGHGHRRNSRVVLIEDEAGGAAEKIERQRRMSVRAPTAPEEPKGRGSVHTASGGGPSPTGSAQLGGTGSQALVSLRRTSVAPRLSVASSDVEDRNRWHDFKNSIVPTCRIINRSRIFLAVMFVALLLALFLPDIWVLTDRHTNLDLDVLLTVIFVAFCFEFAVQCIATYNIYIGSFFFYMDILGAMSLLLDVTYVGVQALIQSAGGVGNQVVIMRAARIAKLGARVGRFTKLVKLLRFLPGLSGRTGDSGGGSAKVINSRLTHSLSTRVSCLIILLVMIIPLFSMWSFPQTDMSLESWSDRLDDISVTRPDVLSRELSRMDSFYLSMDYYPYQIIAKPGATLPNSSLALLPWSSSRPAPTRTDGTQTRESMYLTLSYNWTQVNQTDSAMNLMLLIFVMILMVSFSMVLQKTTSKMVLQPVERLLNQVKDTSAQVFESVPDLGGGPGEDEDNESATEENEDGTWKEANFNLEIHLLDKVVQKVTDLQKKEDKADGGTSQWTGGRREDKEDSGAADKKTKKRIVGSLFVAEEESTPADAMTVVNRERELLEASGLNMELLSDWRVNPMEFDKVMNRAAAAFIIGPANHGIRCEPYIKAFIDEIEADTKFNPYHNWFHAVDVGHSTWRLANICQVTEYLAFHETFAMLVAALCHDLAHPGLNNRFLVETRHPLAMTYNDRSCLESMSSSRLFEIVGQPHSAIFAPLSKSMYNTVRKVTVAAILNTDTAQHFQSVKKVQMFYEMNSEVLSAAAEVYRDQVEEDEEEPVFPLPEVADVFRDANNKQILINLMVHLADTSNSAKPFRICKIWAQKAMEENFLQGDREKALGLPVQAMNDRQNANLAFAQFGFIEYLVAPFLMTVIKVLPPVEPLLAQMMLNAKCWQSLYEQETPSTPEEKEAMQSRVTDLIRLYNECRKGS